MNPNNWIAIAMYDEISQPLSTSIALRHIAGLILFGLVLLSCSTPPDPKPPQPPTPTVTTSTPTPAPKITNVILMIGDGMGPQQIGLLMEYAHRAPTSIYKGRVTALEDIMDQGRIGMSRHGPADGIVVDSACSATQLATGVAAPSEVIGVDAQGNPAETILEKAKKMGKATGLVSDTRITHATPAAFAAHVPHRSMENAIAAAMLKTGPDIMLSGGLRHWIPASSNEEGSTAQQTLTTITGGKLKLKSKRSDERNLIAEAQEAGYEVIFDRTALKSSKYDKILGLFAYSGMMDGIQASRHLH
ncbi:MAG: alkaline phosphatase, partial [Myxococcota bacterium]